MLPRRKKNRFALKKKLLLNYKKIFHGVTISGPEIQEQEDINKNGWSDRSESLKKMWKSNIRET